MIDEPGMFDPLPAGSKAGAPALRVVSEWRVLMPVPEDAPPPPARHPTLGEPARRFEYRDAAGKLLGLVCRFETTDGKQIRPCSFAESRQYGRRWRWLGLPKPRPLYGLDRLAARPAAPVILCEGEKAADAAAILLPTHIAIGSSFGSKSAALTDWAPLAGRQVVIWPDADEAGCDYAAAAGAALAKLSPPATVTIIKPPEGVAEGWDSADAAAAGWTPAQGADLAARAAAPSATPATAENQSRRRKRDGVIALLDEIELWHDQENTAYATVPVRSHWKNCEVDSAVFKNWLAWRCFETGGTVPGNQTIEDALRIAAAIAINRGQCHPTWRRTGEAQGKIYLDLADEHWRAIEIDSHGWRIIDRPPVKFLRSRGMLPLPEPEPGETIEALRKFVNIDADSDFRLLTASLVAALRPSGPFPILLLTGQQGSTKSTLSRVWRALTDPSASPIRSTPKDERDLVVSAYNSWGLVFDNLSKLDPWFSDALCRLSTGGGFATRLLHSDRDEQIFSAQRPIVLNGIGNIGHRADLADRAISLNLSPVSDFKRQPERRFWADFETARPGILGALLDAVAAGLRNLPDVMLKNPPRMADFAEWIVACSPGLGWEEENLFLKDYAANRSDTREEAAAADPLVPVIEALLVRSGVPADHGIIVDTGKLEELLARKPEDGERAFNGLASDLLNKLRDICDEKQQRARWFPVNDARLGTQLSRAAPLLEERGISVVLSRGTDRKRDRHKKIFCRSAETYNALRDRIGPPPRKTEDGST